MLVSVRVILTTAVACTVWTLASAGVLNLTPCSPSVFCKTMSFTAGEADNREGTHPTAMKDNGKAEIHQLCSAIMHVATMTRLQGWGASTATGSSIPSSGEWPQRQLWPLEKTATTRVHSGRFRIKIKTIPTTEEAEPWYSTNPSDPSYESAHGYKDPIVAQETNPKEYLKTVVLQGPKAAVQVDPSKDDKSYHYDEDAKD